MSVARASTMGVSPPPFLDTVSAPLEDWKSWKQQWENYAIVAKLSSEPPEYRTAMFLHSIGPSALKTYNGMTFEPETDDHAAEDPKDLDTLIRKFDNHFIGEVNETFERYHFNKRDQRPDENIYDYVTALRTLAKTCNFGELHDSLVRDRIVIGIIDQSTRKRLLERDLSLKKCISICKSMEASRSRLKEFGATGAEAQTVHRVQQRDKGKGYTPKRSSTRFTKPSEQRQQDCEFCGYKHIRSKEKCPAWGKTCKKCNGENHFAKKCRRANIHMIQDEGSSSSDCEWIDCITMREIVSTVTDGTDEIYAEMLIDETPVKFQIDCGASANLLPAKYTNGYQRDPCKKTLLMWNKSEVKPLGTTRLKLRNPQNRMKYSVEFIVVKENLAPLLGAKAVQHMGLITVNNSEFKRVASVRDKTDPTAELLEEYKDVFGDGLGKLPGKAHLETDPTVPPVISPPRRVPIALKDRLKAELDRLQDFGVLSPVDQPTDWVSQLVICTKKSGDLRLCIDPRPLNRALKREHHPLPIIEDILPDLQGAKVFSKADLASGYWHVELDEASSLLTTFQTPHGRYKSNRLPFGIKNASEIFEKRLQQALLGLGGTIVIRDDITIIGKGASIEEAKVDHDSNLRAFLQRCQEKGISLNQKKCEWRKSEVTLMGHVISADGLKADPDKIEAVTKLQEPKDVHEVQRLVGFVNYLAKFMPRLSDVLEPIRLLTRQDIEWHWDRPQASAFAEIKRLVTTTPVLAYYEPQKELVVQCDASEKGLGATLLQGGRPLTFASRALTDTETRYAQIEKELLAIVFAMERFDQYTRGRLTVVHSDHKPLETIVKKPLASAPRRLQGMLMRLQRYEIEVRYRPGREMHIADMLSRAYLPCSDRDKCEFEQVNMAKFLPIRPERLAAIQAATDEDEALQTLKRVVLQGWPEDRADVPAVAMPYFSMRDEITVQDALLFKGDRIIIPASLRAEMRARIHVSHWCRWMLAPCSRMFILARHVERDQRADWSL